LPETTVAAAVQAKFRRTKVSSGSLSCPILPPMIRRLTPCPLAIRFCREIDAPPRPEGHRRPRLLQPPSSSLSGSNRGR
jgi:hypothetical protein